MLPKQSSPWSASHNPQTECPPLDRTKQGIKSAIKRMGAVGVLVLLAACGGNPNAEVETELQESGSTGATTVSGPHLYASNECLFAGNLRSTGAKSLLVGDIVSAFVEPAIDVLFRSVTAAIKEAAKPQEVTLTAHKNLLADDPYPGPETGQGAKSTETDKSAEAENATGAEKTAETNETADAENAAAGFPVCLQFIDGTIFAQADDWNNLESTRIKVTRETFGEEKHLEAHKFLNQRRIYLAAKPRLFLELYLKIPKDLGVLAATPTLVLFDHPAMGDRNSTRDVAVTLQISNPTSAGNAAAGELLKFNIANVASMTTFVELDPGTIETPWASFSAPSSVQPRTVKVTVTETEDGNAFLGKVAEVLEKASPALKEQAVARLDPKKVADAKLKAANLKDTVREELARLKLDADRKIKTWKAAVDNKQPNEITFDDREKAIDALAAVNATNSKARERGASIVYDEGKVATLVNAASGE